MNILKALFANGFLYVSSSVIALPSTYNLHDGSGCFGSASSVNTIPSLSGLHSSGNSDISRQAQYHVLHTAGRFLYILQPSCFEECLHRISAGFCRISVLISSSKQQALHSPHIRLSSTLCDGNILVNDIDLAFVIFFKC